MTKEKTKEKKGKMKKPTELLEKREHLGVNYEVWETPDGLEYRVTKGLEPFKMEGSSKRTLTIQMKKEIEARLKAQNNQHIESEPPKDVDLGISEEDEDEIFDISQFDPDDVEEEEVVVESSIPQETKGSEVGATSSEVDSSERRTSPPEKMSDTDVDALDDEEDWEESPKSSMEESAEELENETELEEEPVIDTELPKTETHPKIPTLKDYPEVIPHELKLSCIVVDGKMYGKVGKRTYITVKDKGFTSITSKKFAEMRRGKTVRVIPLKIKNVPVEIDSELIFRFFINEGLYLQKSQVSPFYHLGKGGGALWVVPNDYYVGSDLVSISDGTMLDRSKFMGLVSAKSSGKWLEGAEIVTKRTFPPDSPLCCRFNDQTNIGKDIYAKALDVIGSRGNRRLVNPDNILIFEMAYTKDLVIVAPTGKPKYESDESWDEPDIEEVPEEEE